MLPNLLTFIEIGEQEAEMRTDIQQYFEQCMDAILVKELLKISEKPFLIGLVSLLFPKYYTISEELDYDIRSINLS